MPQRRRIFLSATNRDLASYRDLASVALRRRGYETVEQPTFNLTDDRIAKLLEDKLKDCDAVVCLIGTAYGGEPSARIDSELRRSYTQLEYFVARRLNKPVFLFVADESTPFERRDDSEPDELQVLQRDYRKEATRDRDWRAFADGKDLRFLLAELRFPWEQPPPDKRPNNIPIASIGKLFKGRDAYLDDLHASLGATDAPDAAAIVATQAIHGLGGIGKTRAAVEYSWKYEKDYRALLLVRADSPGALRANLANLNGPLGIETDEPNVELRLALVFEWLEMVPGWLLILDNVDTPEAALEVKNLLPRLRAGHVLITSRLADFAAGIGARELHVLDEAAAVAYLLDATPNRRRRPNDSDTALAVARELDGHALALEVAAAYISSQHRSFAEYLDLWRVNRDKVLTWHDPRLLNYPASVAAAWETSFALLNEAEHRLLSILSWLAPAPLPLWLFDSEDLSAAVPDPRAVLAALAGYSLVHFEDTGDSVTVHRLLQQITRTRAENQFKVESLQVALTTVDGLMPFDSDDVQTWNICTPLAPHTAEIVRHADAARLADPTTSLMNQLALYQMALGQYPDAERLLRRALAIDRRAYGDDHPTVAIRLTNLARLLQDTNRLADAEPLVRQALDIGRRAYGDDHPEVVNCLSNLAQLLQATNRLADAEPLMRQVLDIAQRAYGEDHPKVATALNNLALLLRATNRLADAEPLIRQALDIDRRAYRDDHPTVAIRLTNLAQLLKATNRLADAEPLMLQALDIGRKAYGEDHPRVAIDLNNLAQLFHDTNRLADAEPLMSQALDIDRRAYGDDHPIVARDLNNLARLLQATNRLADAEPLMRQAVGIWRRFRETTGHEHPHWRVGVSNYQGMLQAMGLSPKQIAQRLGEATGETGEG
jgi:tetratricopeptide (TPR) repeat protein